MHGVQLLVSVYRVMSSVLVKLGEADLGWLAADRAVATAGDDPVLAGAAAVSIGHALRALGRGRLAMAATVAAAHRIAPVPAPECSGKLAVQGALLLQAALAAAGCVEGRRVEELTGQAIEIAARVDARDDPHQTSFGLVAVELARIVAAVELGDAEEAVYRHEQAIRREAWRLSRPNTGLPIWWTPRGRTSRSVTCVARGACWSTRMGSRRPRSGVVRRRVR